MPKRDPGLLVEDILSAIGKIGEYTVDMDLKQFISDGKTVDAVVRNLEIIGEAARQCPETFKNKHPDIPWGQITGLRNRIVHDYAGVDVELIWQIIRNDLSGLKNKLA